MRGVFGTANDNRGGWRVAVAVLAIVLAPVASAAEPKALGTFGAWSAYRVADGKTAMCYLHAKPEKSVGNYAKRGAVFAQVAHRPQDRVKGETSLTAGYAFKIGSEVTVAIGDKRFALFTDADTAWARDKQTDAALVQEMIKGTTMVVRGDSARGTTTTDSYALAGFAAAYKAIDQACP